MSSYGFGKSDGEPVKLPQVSKAAPEKRGDMTGVLQAGSELGFVSRDTSARRKPGPKRTEPQDKITVAGRKRVIDRLRAYCDSRGGLSYCDAIEALLDEADRPSSR